MPKKKEFKKMAIFRPKPWVNPFKKFKFFDFLNFFFFIAKKAVYSFENIVKDIFFAYIASKQKVKKWPFLDQNHGLTRLEECKFFHFSNFLFL